MPSRREFFRTLLAGAAGIVSFPKLALFSPGQGSPPPTLPEAGAQFWSELQKQFPQTAGEVFFNNATIGAMPLPVVRRVVERTEELNRTVARWDYKPDTAVWFTGYYPENEVRKKLAAILHCAIDELALTQNATMGMNEIAMGLDLQAGEEIVQTNQEHPGGQCGWLVREKRDGLVLKKVEIPIPPNDPGELIQRFKDAISPKTRVLAIPHITSMLGLVMPVKEIVGLYREQGIFTVIDGAQAVGQIHVDVQDIGCDAYFSSPHKWLLAPAGNGCLYVRKEIAGKIWTVLASSQWANEEDPGFRLQQRGTGNLPLLDGLAAAADFFQSVGPDRWISRIKELGDRLRAGLQQIEGVEIFSSTHPELAAGMTTYRAGGWHGTKMQDFFWEKKRMRPRSMGEQYGVRHSVHIYHSEAEIDAALDVVREISELDARE